MGKRVSGVVLYACLLRIWLFVRFCFGLGGREISLGGDLERGEKIKRGKGRGGK